jgi:hypothetical protein
MYALNMTISSIVKTHRHNAFRHSAKNFCCSSEHGCQAAQSNAASTEVNGGTVAAAIPQRVGKVNVALSSNICALWRLVLLSPLGEVDPPFAHKRANPNASDLFVIRRPA